MDDIRTVYDLFCPSPSPLKELASIELAMHLWRREIIKLRVNKTLREWESISNVRAASQMPNLPRSLAPGVDRYIDGIIVSIKQWYDFHWIRETFHPNPTCNVYTDYGILNHFVDFVADWDGSIHYERTARRMIMCDGIDADLKFRMACVYCLVEDIVKLWPSVSSYMFLDRLYFDYQTELYYWVARLRNQLNDVPLVVADTTIEDAVIHYTDDEKLWPMMKYFAISGLPKYASRTKTFVRYLLPWYLANEELLAEALPFVKRWFMESRYQNSKRILAVWACIKDKITSNDCVEIIEAILYNLVRGNIFVYDSFSLVELWNSTSDEFKKLQTDTILKSVHKMIFVLRSSDQEILELSLLLAILPYASTENRNGINKKLRMFHRWENS